MILDLNIKEAGARSSQRLAMFHQVIGCDEASGIALRGHGLLGVMADMARTQCRQGSPTVSRPIEA